MFDLAVIESDGNGGDVQLLGNDLAVIKGVENQIFLALFGGNIEQSTVNNNSTEADSKDFWGNKLFLPNEPNLQFNSETERVLNNTPLTSSGRTIIESAVKKDLDFFTDFGTVDITVDIVSDDRLNINIKAIQQIQKEKIIIVKLKKKATGDWFIMDFNNDFYFG
jgi:hypothetical protein